MPPNAVNTCSLIAWQPLLLYLSAFSSVYLSVLSAALSLVFSLVFL